MSAKQYEVGLRIRKEVMGKEYVEKALEGADEFNHDFQKIVTEYCWGGVWGRGVLDKKQRSFNNLCILAALNRQHEFKLHFRGALRNGCTLDELQETLIQIAVYCGIPAGVEAFRIAREVFQEEGIEVPPKPVGADNPPAAASGGAQ